MAMGDSGNPRIDRYVAQQRQRLATAEAEVQRQLEAQYHVTLNQVSPHIRSWSDAYSRELARVRNATGDPLAQVSDAWAKQHLDGAAGQELQRFVQAEVGRFAKASQDAVDDGLATASDLGVSDAGTLMTAALSPLTAQLAQKSLTPGDLVNTIRGDALTGFESNWLSEAGQARLANLWYQFGDQASLQLYQLLHGAIRSGDNPNAVAPGIRNLLVQAGARPTQEALAMSQAITQAWQGQMGRYLSQARTIARTEMLGAYRSAQLANYRANSDVVQGWTWSASVGACPVCTDLDGTFHTLDESMDGAHANCRCSPQPITNSWADILGPLGIDTSDIEETSFQPQLGSDWFAEQDAAYQRDILGPSAFNAYQAGALRLDDLVGRTEDGQYYQKSMKDLGLNANAWLGKGPNAGIPIRIDAPGGGFTYVTPGPQVVEEPIFNMAGRSAGWSGVDAAMAGLRGDAAGEAAGEAAQAADSVTLTRALADTPYTGPSDEYLQQVSETLAPRIEQYAALHPEMTVEEYKAAVSEKLQSLVSGDVTPSVRVPSDVLDKILADGRLKTAHEAGKLGGSAAEYADYNTARTRFEESAFGYTADAAVEERPISGYVVGTGTDNTFAMGYGDARLVLTDDMRARATTTFGDSLDYGEGKPSMTPRPIDQMAWDAYHYPASDNPVRDWGEAGLEDYRAGLRAFDPLSWNTISDYAHAGGQFSDSYVEMQFHGGVSVSDIAEIQFNGATPPSAELVKRLDEQGIKWSYDPASNPWLRANLAESEEAKK